MNGREYRNLGQAAFASQTVLPRGERNCLNPDDQKRDRASCGQPGPRGGAMRRERERGAAGENRTPDLSLTKGVLYL